MCKLYTEIMLVLTCSLNSSSSCDRFMLCLCER